MHDQKTIWWQFEQKIPLELEESIFWKLNDLGIKSFSFESPPEKLLEKKLRIWLCGRDWSELRREKLVADLKSLVFVFGSSFSEYTWTHIPDEDWSSTWKKNWAPDPVGDSLLILPAWLDIPDEFTSKLVIRLDPGSAFGTGSHPTTRLCLEQLEQKPPVEISVIDVGCGSGILSLAALRLGAKKVYAIDIDPLAIHAIKHNFFLNSFKEGSLTSYLGSIDVLKSAINFRKADLLVCNILAPVIKILLPSFSQILQPKGHALISGILVDQISDMRVYLDSHGWEVVRTSDSEGWGLIEIAQKAF